MTVTLEDIRSDVKDELYTAWADEGRALFMIDSHSRSYADHMERHVRKRYSGLIAKENPNRKQVDVLATLVPR